MHFLLPLTALASVSLATPHAKPKYGKVSSPVPSDKTATVNLSKKVGKPQHLASGFIYGIPDTPDQVPDHFYTDIGFNYGRAGGAQLEAPARGWLYGLEEYRNRLNSSLSNQFTCRKYGAKYIILPHDIWGTDHANASTVWPGDNGDWTDYDLYINTLMSDLKAANALEGLVFDIWNEPDISIFWNRTQAQWVELYTRTNKLLRADPDFDVVETSGPSLAFRPLANNTWWTSWLEAIKEEDAVPDQYSYHLEGQTYTEPDNDIAVTNGTLAALLQQYDLPLRPTNINEYANSGEQRPAGAAWWISRLERYDAIGLRGNWLGGLTLHDLFANLLNKTRNPFDYTATDYVPAGEFQVYKYYNLNMTGERVATNGSTDKFFDVYATENNGAVKVLAGSRVTAGNWSIAVGPIEGAAKSVKVKKWDFPGKTQWTVVYEPVYKGEVEVPVRNGVLTLNVATDNTTGHAFEFSVGKSSSGYY